MTFSMTSPASRVEWNAGVSINRLETVSNPFCFEISMPMPINSLVIICSKSCICRGQTMTVYGSRAASEASANCETRIVRGKSTVASLSSSVVSKIFKKSFLLSLLEASPSSSRIPSMAAHQADSSFGSQAMFITFELLVPFPSNAVLNLEDVPITSASSLHCSSALVAISL